MTGIAGLLGSFFRKEDATVTLEVVLILPLLFWGYFGLFALFDGYRSLNDNVNAAYVIGDLLSRETRGITPEYVEGLNDLQDILTQSPHRTVLRVSVVEYDADLKSHELKWSFATDGKPKIEAGQVGTALVGFLPDMFDGEQLIVVETWMAFVPIFDITTLKGDRSQSVFEAFYFESVSITRPRFAPQLCWISCVAS